MALSQKVLENDYFSNINTPNHYHEQKILTSFFTVLGGKFKFSAQDSDLEYLCWRCKNSPVSSDLKLPLEVLFILHTSSYFTNSRFKLDLKDPMYI